VQVPRCRWQSKALDKAPYKLSGAVAKLANITFLSLAFSYWIDNLGFVTEGKLAAIFIKPSPGVSNWPVIYIINYTPTSYLALFNTAPSVFTACIPCAFLGVTGDPAAGYARHAPVIFDYTDVTPSLLV
jgi:hypothetical protein